MIYLTYYKFTIFTDFQTRTKFIMRYSFGDYLFDGASKNIKECLEDISEEEVKDCCDYKVFLRGREYYEEGRVEYLHHNEANNTLMATVIGSDEYQIELRKNSRISGFNEPG